MRAEGGHLLHNYAHITVPLLMASIFIITYPSLNPYDAAIIALFGGLLPDIDHINIWLEYKFKNFRSFLRFVTKARRYRFSFLIFHNLGTVIALVLLIPVVNAVSPLGTLFLLAFLCHLMMDFADDKFTIGRVTHWRYRRRT